MKIFDRLKSYFLMSKGSMCLAKRNYIGAIEFFKKANRLNSNEAVILLSLGDAYFQAGHYSEAKNVLKKALSLDPHNTMALEWMVHTLNELNSPIEEIIPHLKTYLNKQKLHQDRFPKIMKIATKSIAKVSGKEVDIDSYERKLDKRATDFYLWARKTVDEFEKE